MTLYFVATVAGEQTHILRLSVLPVKSIIASIVWLYLTYVKARSINY
jgi:hypothetical protein